MTALLARVSQKPFYFPSENATFPPLPPPSQGALNDFPSTLAIPGHDEGPEASSKTRVSSVSLRKESPRIGDENSQLFAPLQSATKATKPDLSDLSRPSSNQSSRHSTWDKAVPLPSDIRALYALHPEASAGQDVDLAARGGSLVEEERGRLRKVTDKQQSVTPLWSKALAENSEHRNVQQTDGPSRESFPDLTTNAQDPHRGLRRWMSVLRRKHVKDRHTVNPDVFQEMVEEDQEPLQRILASEQSQKRSSSLSSGGLVSVVKSASAGIVNHGWGLSSRKNGVASRRQSGARSSEASNPRVRASEDSGRGQLAPVYDEAVWQRAVQRRRILEELISSEESYIADMKILVNVYFALLASVPALSEHIRTSIHRNVKEILDLHEQLLGDLHRVVPASEYSQRHKTRPQSATRRRRNQRSSEGLTSEHDGHGKNIRMVRSSVDNPRSDHDHRVSNTTEPKVIKEVAQAFSAKLKCFFAYEEYGAKYEMLVANMGSTYKTIPTWHAYERGIEALANSLSSSNGQGAPSRKGLTFEDLIIKPIQRVCKYPLLFAELYKATPVCDCPESHAELEKVLYRLREVTAEINKATHDPQTRDRIEKTWLLQDKLIFPNELQVSQMVTLRLLGRVVLCGVLHVAWQSRSRVHGAFMVCVLFRSNLVLASAKDSCQTFAVVACIGLESIQVEQADSGRGLQSHTAPFTWKIVFQFDFRLFEVVVSACSAKEEEVWKTALHDRSIAEKSGADDRQAKGPSLLTSLTLDLKPIGNVFGQAGTLARRISIQRASTIGSKSGLSHVIIKNTQALKDGQDSHPYSMAEINRSQSLLSTARIPIISTRRSDRVRLEHLLADLWTRDVIPYPGMGGRRGEYLIKASASSMMRKLSIASIASTFTKRSTSYASLSYGERENLSSITDDPVQEPSSDVGGTIRRKNSEEKASNSSKESLEDRTNALPAQVIGTESKVIEHTTSQKSTGRKGTEQAEPSDPMLGESKIIPTSGKASRDGGRRAGKLTRKWSIDGIRKLFK